MVEALCTRCGAEKDLPLGRCPHCAHLPTGPERELAMLCSQRFFSAAELRDLQARIRRGDPLRPSAALLAQARALLGARPALRVLSRQELLLLTVGNLLLTPLLGYATWYGWRDHPAGRQALWVTLPISLLLLLVWLYYYFFHGA